MTGRAAGYCTGNGVPGYANAGGGFGRGMGFRAGQGFGARCRRGRGMGAGCRGGAQWGGDGMPAAAPPPAPTPEQEANLLKAQAQSLETALADIQKRLTDLETEQ